MHESEAARHESSRDHTNRVREISAPPASSPFHVSSPPEQHSSQPASPAVDTHFPPFQTISGPYLPGDDEDGIFDNWNPVWGPGMPEKPDEEPEELATNDGWEDDNGSDYLSDSGSVDGHSLVPEDDPFDEFNHPVDSDSETEECSDNHDFGETVEHEDEDMSGPVNTKSEWWPWANREEALLDIMTAFPRSVFSEPELEATRWFASKCGVDHLPSIRQVKSHRSKVLDLCGAAVKTVDGTLGNTFAVLDLGRLLRDEFANPLVRPFIRVLSEDSGETLRQASQAEKWRVDVSPDLSGPMVRLDGRDFYVNEPALVHVGGDSGADWAAVLPSRWFLRDNKIWAKAQRLRSHPTEDGLLIDNRSNQCEEIPLSDFFASFSELASVHKFHGLKNPSRILGYANSGEHWDMEHLSIEPCDIKAPNPWRAIANGRRVETVPVWVYCDDTSGNISKKWNKHNSILMSLAGLDSEKAHLLYNVIFLATSNLAHPLEMFDAVVEALKAAQKTGIEAYDCAFDEMVLLIPWIIAMLGDNPMQSEFASHIGLSGKCFCRVCHVRGADTKNRPAGDAGDRERVREFLSTSTARSKEDTLEKLKEQLVTYLRGAPSTAKTEATETGVKDKYFQHFADQLAEACAKIKEASSGHDYLVKVLQELRDKMPPDETLFSPALRLDDFDPNSDSPVEILHVILLGFVKYFWRDAVSRQDKDSKEILKARINSFDTSALGLAKARGNTLVQYAGSLTGRDFRLVLQLAPAVLYGLIPDKAYEAWLALCRMAPLVYQPEITDLSAYLKRLQSAVDDFLAATALWNTQWFNKPKFTFSYILCTTYANLGPPFFALRKRLTPSLDIASAFSHMHAVRHLVSGGYIVLEKASSTKPLVRQAGRAVQQLKDDAVFVRLMGMSDFVSKSRTGKYTLEVHASTLTGWSDTQAHTNLPALSAPSGINELMILRKCSKVVLSGGDSAHVQGFIIFRNPVDDLSALRIGKVLEILADEYSGVLLGLLVHEYAVGTTGVLPYRFPSLTPTTGVWFGADCSSTQECTVHTKFQPSTRYPNLPKEDIISQAVENRRSMTTASAGLAIQTLPTTRAGKGKRKRTAPAADSQATGPGPTEERPSKNPRSQLPTVPVSQPPPGFYPPPNEPPPGFVQRRHYQQQYLQPLSFHDASPNQSNFYYNPSSAETRNIPQTDPYQNPSDWFTASTSFQPEHDSFNPSAPHNSESLSYPDPNYYPNHYDAYNNGGGGPNR
ncbi:hypothetical protein C8R43DRAFT_1132056 [Mycena crocata]|nr:hypothetical protein C8R43DRAFT_1132056 [Mycena crocata]